MKRWNIKKKIEIKKILWMQHIKRNAKSWTCYGRGKKNCDSHL